MNKETSSILKRIHSGHRRIAALLFELEKQLAQVAPPKLESAGSGGQRPRPKTADKLGKVKQLEAALNAGKSINQAAYELRVPASTASRWLAAYRKDGAVGLEPKKSPGRPRKQKEGQS
jgi:hypothetical protein